MVKPFRSFETDPEADLNDRDYLIDISRLVWRAWRGRPATGIDRVCLAYLRHFGSRAHAVIQRRGFIFVLSPRRSDHLRQLLLQGPRAPRMRLAVALGLAVATARRSPPRMGMLYLNVGHTGLNERALPRWITRNKVRAIYMIHDLIPLTHPQYCRPGEAAKHKRRMRNALVSAHGTIGNSRDTLRELEEFARSMKLEMPPNAAVWISGHGGGKVEYRRPRTIAGPYFVAVGTIEARKNHILLLRLWERMVEEMGEEAPTLVIIGQRGWEADEALRRLDRLGALDGHVLEINSCDDEQLAGWIAGARAMLMPSFVEGFGLPVIESLELGTPVIASDLPVFREIVGDIPTYLDPKDDNAWHETVKRFMDDDSERQCQITRIASYRAPNWVDHFAKIEKWLDTL